jgi:hypothetical protein
MDVTIDNRSGTRTHNAVARATWLLLAAAAAAGALVLPAAPHIALLPLAVVFGWTQIGGV